MTKNNYTLYMYRTCPFCVKVQRFLDEKALTLPTIYLDDDQAALEDLYHKTQSAQAPCLKINDDYMRESDDIIAYIEKELA